jgi:hypothetical protein
MRGPAPGLTVVARRRPLFRCGKTTRSAPPRAAAPGCRFDPVTRAVGAPPVDVGAADALAVIGRLLKGAAHADKVGTSTVGADARRGLKGWGGHERSVRAPTGKGNGMNSKSVLLATSMVLGCTSPSRAKRRCTLASRILSENAAYDPRLLSAKPRRTNVPSAQRGYQAKSCDFIR